VALGITIHDATPEGKEKISHVGFFGRYQSPTSARGQGAGVACRLVPVWLYHAMIKPKHLIAIMVGITVVSILLLTGYIYLFVKSMTEDNSIKNLTRLLRDWQTQSGAGFAVLAAILAGAAVVYQTAVSAKIEDRRKKKEKAI
jgi:hypothetical protein